jgi:hypothetical protein
MSHNIERSEHAIYSAAEGAGWTGLGRAIPSEYAKDPAKMAEMVGATFQVVARPIYYRDTNVSEAAPKGTVHQADGFMAQIRNDTGALLGITSENRYHTDHRQPADIFEAFRDQLAKDGLTISHAVMLGGGSRIAVCALLPSEFDIQVMPGDTVKTYRTLSTGYTGKHGTIKSESGIRVVCENTLEYSIDRAARDGKLSVIRASTQITDASLLSRLVAGEDVGADTSDDVASGRWVGKLKTVANTVRLVQRQYQELANASVSDLDVQRYFCDVLKIQFEDLERKHKDGRDVVSTKSKNMIRALSDAYKSAPGASMARGTAWGALNAVTYYATHQKTVRDTSGAGAHIARFASNMDGDAADLKKRALALAGERFLVAA